MPFQLPDLPFAKDALAPLMSAETLEFHHGKHHKAYVTKTNELLERRADLSGASLVQVVQRGAARPATTSCSTTARSCGTTASSGNASRRRRASSPTASSRKLIDDALRQRRGAAREAAGGSGQPFRQRLGVAGARPRQLARHLAPRCRHADRPRGHGAAVHARCVGARLLHRLSQRAAAVRERACSSNIVNWDFVAQNLDGQGFERANQEGERAIAGAYCLSR